MRLKIIFALFLFSSALFSKDDLFITDAKNLAADLKKSLVQNLSQKIAQEGVVEAVPFCHGNVKLIAKASAGNRVEKYEFGRTSHKIRNVSNAPQPWALKYLKEFEGKKKNEVKSDYIIHQLDSGKKIYLEPLYVEAKCLLCHGSQISPTVSSKIKKLYPDDKATGFNLGEFRGFIWVKEKE